MEKREAKDFYHDGFGWKCRVCAKISDRPEQPEQRRARLLREGEAESKIPELSNPGLAKWADPASRQTLLCPVCGNTEDLV